MRFFREIFLIGVLLLSNVLSAQPSPERNATEDSVSNESVDPTAEMLAMTLKLNLAPSEWNSKDEDRSDTTFSYSGPFSVWKRVHLLSVAIPFHETPRAGVHDVQIQHLFPVHLEWGSYGVGIVVNLNPVRVADKDSFQAGPSLALLMKASRFNYGILMQNLIGRYDSISILTPLLNWQIGEGYSLSLAELHYLYEWKSGEFKTVPVGLQLNKVKNFDGQFLRFFVAPYRETRFPNTGVAIGATIYGAPLTTGR